MGVRIKGSVIAARKVFVTRHFGADAWERVLAAMPDDDRATLGQLVEIGWYAFDLGERLDRAIVDVLGRGDRTVFERLGAASARENLTGSHRFYLKPGRPQAFLKLTESLYHLYYEQGRREYEPTGPCSGVMTTHDADTFSAADCLTVVGWYREALAMCGAQDIEVVEECCRATGGDVCRYRLSWRTAVAAQAPA